MTVRSAGTASRIAGLNRRLQRPYRRLLSASSNGPTISGDLIGSASSQEHSSAKHPTLQLAFGAHRNTLIAHCIRPSTVSERAAALCSGGPGFFGATMVPPSVTYRAQNGHAVVTRRRQSQHGAFTSTRSSPSCPRSVGQEKIITLAAWQCFSPRRRQGEKQNGS
jgi:hypothetical protein